MPEACLWHDAAPTARRLGCWRRNALTFCGFGQHKAQWSIWEIAAPRPDAARLCAGSARVAKGSVSSSSASVWWRYQVTSAALAPVITGHGRGCSITILLPPDQAGRLEVHDIRLDAGGALHSDPATRVVEVNEQGFLRNICACLASMSCPFRMRSTMKSTRCSTRPGMPCTRRSPLIRSERMCLSPVPVQSGSWRWRWRARSARAMW